MLIVREIKIFLFLFLILTLFMHFNAWIDYPIEHFNRLPHSSLGIWHPFYITMILYLLTGIIRWFIKILKHVSKKNAKH